MTSTFLIAQTLNSATFAALLFLVASGFTVIFGMLRIVNLAHGGLYLLGGYFSFSLLRLTGAFFLSVLLAAAAVGLLGVALLALMRKLLSGHELAQVLLTLGLTFVIADSSLLAWGGDPLSIPVPAWLQGAVELGPLVYPKYRCFVLGVGIAVAAGIWLLVNRTRMGALVRAGVDDAEMVDALGIDIERVFLWTFFAGSALAGLAGGLGGVFLTLYPGADGEILVLSLAVVIIGGLGSLEGTLVGSLLVALLNTFGQVLFPELAYFVVFAPMALLLSFRPWGLLGRPS